MPEFEPNLQISSDLEIHFQEKSLLENFDFFSKFIDFILLFQPTKQEFLDMKQKLKQTLLEAKKFEDSLDQYSEILFKIKELYNVYLSLNTHEKLLFDEIIKGYHTINFVVKYQDDQFFEWIDLVEEGKSVIIQAIAELSRFKQYYLKLDEILKEPNASIISIKDEIKKLSREKNAYLQISIEKMLSFTWERLSFIHQNSKEIQKLIESKEQKKERTINNIKKILNSGIYKIKILKKTTLEITCELNLDTEIEVFQHEQLQEMSQKGLLLSSQMQKLESQKKNSELKTEEKGEQKFAISFIKQLQMIEEVGNLQLQLFQAGHFAFKENSEIQYEAKNPEVFTAKLQEENKRLQSLLEEHLDLVKKNNIQKKGMCFIPYIFYKTLFDYIAAINLKQSLKQEEEVQDLFCYFLDCNEIDKSNFVILDQQSLQIADPNEIKAKSDSEINRLKLGFITAPLMQLYN